MEYCLADININQRVRVISLGTTGNLFRRKLLSMGVLPNTEISIIRKAPMGGSLELSLRGFSLSLRRNEAQGIQVELMSIE